MKASSTVLLALLLLPLCAQPLKFQGALVDTITIQSKIGVYQFDVMGTTKGKSDHLHICYSKEIAGYLVSKYFQERTVRTTRPDRSKVKTRRLKKQKGREISTKDLQELLDALDTNLAPPQLFEQIDTAAFKEYISGKQIRKVAKQYQAAWHFKRKYATTAENEQFFKSCQSMDSLMVYLSEVFDHSGYAMSMDFYDNIEIYFSTAKSNFRFEGKFPNPVKQPWYDHSGNALLPSPILNLRINQALEKILPKGFLGKSGLTLKVLANHYIGWYLQRRNLISTRL